MAPKTDPNFKVVADNRKARFNYAIGDTVEAGIALTGTEVKSLRVGKATIAESYADTKGEELWLVNTNTATNTHYMRSVLMRYPGVPVYYYGPFAGVDLGRPSTRTDRPLPWSIVDASAFRGIRGELFSIGEAYHLLQYTP